MAAANWTAIETAIRGVLEGTYGTVQVVTAGRLLPALTPERTAVSKTLGTKTASRYALEGPRDGGEHPGSPPRNASPQLIFVDFTVILWTKLRHPRHAKETRAIQTTYAAATAKMVRNALEWPGNLDAGDASAATGIIAGSVSQVSASPIREFGEETVAEQTLSFRGIVLETLPVT
jgi:hypothetical protein